MEQLARDLVGCRGAEPMTECSETHEVQWQEAELARRTVGTQCDGHALFGAVDAAPRGGNRVTLRRRLLRRWALQKCKEVLRHLPPGLETVFRCPPEERLAEAHQMKVGTEGEAPDSPQEAEQSCKKVREVEEMDQEKQGDDMTNELIIMGMI